MTTAQALENVLNAWVNGRKVRDGIPLTIRQQAEQALLTADAQATVEALQAVIDDHHRLVRELDVSLHGEDGAAKQASLCDLVSQIQALQRVRDEFERERDQLHAALVEAVLLRDHNLRRCDVLDSKYKKGLAAVKVLQSQLSQLQALVRAYLEARKSIDSDLAEQARENLKHALDATTPAVCPDCDGDGAVDSGGTDPNGNPSMRQCGCREKGGDGE